MKVRCSSLALLTFASCAGLRSIAGGEIHHGGRLNITRVAGAVSRFATHNEGILLSLGNGALYNQTGPFYFSLGGDRTTRAQIRMLGFFFCSSASPECVKSFASFFPLSTAITIQYTSTWLYNPTQDQLALCWRKEIP